MSNISIQRTEEREDRLRRLMQATGEKTMAGALDVAAKHYIRDLRAKERCIDKMCDEVIDELDGPWIPLDRNVTHNVGRTED